jgi:hypothetical protein
MALTVGASATSRAENRGSIAFRHLADAWMDTLPECNAPYLYVGVPHRNGRTAAGRRGRLGVRRLLTGGSPKNAATLEADARRAFAPGQY